MSLELVSFMFGCTDVLAFALCLGSQHLDIRIVLFSSSVDHGWEHWCKSVLVQSAEGFPGVWERSALITPIYWWEKSSETSSTLPFVAFSRSQV